MNMEIYIYIYILIYIYIYTYTYLHIYVVYCQMSVGYCVLPTAYRFARSMLCASLRTAFSAGLQMQQLHLLGAETVQARAESIQSWNKKNGLLISYAELGFEIAPLYLEAWVWDDSEFNEQIPGVGIGFARNALALQPK